MLAQEVIILHFDFKTKITLKVCVLLKYLPEEEATYINCY